MHQNLSAQPAKETRRGFLPRIHTMRRRTAILSLSTFLGILCLVTIASAQTPPPAAGAPASQEVYPTLAAKALSQGSVPVIVGLDLAFEPEGVLSGPQAAVQQRATIGSTQGFLLQQLSSYGVTSVKQFQFIPFMALEVDAKALQFLAASPLVQSLVEDVAVPPSLDLSIPLINADDAWAAGYEGAGQAVAILDSGVDSAHAFLSGKVVSEACYSSTTTDAVTVCPNGLDEQTGPGAGVNCPVSVGGCEHGTHVAGIAAGDGSSFDGVARAADIIAVQVFSRFDDATICSPRSAPCVLAYNSDIILALERVYALRNDFDIAAVNLSLGGGRYYATCDAEEASRKAAVDNLRAAGIATVAASGNNGYSDSMLAPACISTVISVGSSTSHAPADNISSFSNSASFLDLLAPGDNIVSSVPGGGYEGWAGTSMATPHVAGAWAVLKSKQPGAPVAEILAALTSTGAPILDGRNGITKPRIDLLAAINSLGDPRPYLHQPADGSRTYNSTPTFEWGSLSGATAYQFQVDDDPSFASALIDQPTASTSYTPAAPLPEGTYHWRVKATLAGGDTDWSDAWSFVLAGGAALPFYDGFESGALGDAWFPYTTDEGRVRVSTDYPDAGSYSLLLDDHTGNTIYSYAAADLMVDLTGQSEVTLEFRWREFSDENNTGDGVFLSDDHGSTWYQALSFNNGPSSFRSETIDLDAAAAAGGLALNNHFLIRFQFYDNYPITSDGYALDEVRVTGDYPAPDALTASASSPSQIDLTWQDNSSDETAFHVERSPDGSTSWIEIGIAAANTTTYPDSGLDCGFPYYYRVRAYWSVNDRYSAYSNAAHDSTPLCETARTLAPGWNLISFQPEPPDPSVAAVLASIDGLYCRVLSETGIHDCNLDPIYRTLGEMHGAISYYLRLDNGTEAGLQVQGFAIPVDTPLPLAAGWNWIGYLPDTTLPIETALASIDGQYDLVHSLNQTAVPGDPVYSTLTHMEPGQGYLIHATQATSLVYPTSAGLAQSIGTGHDLAPLHAWDACSDVTPTPTFTLVYGKLADGGAPPPLGTVIEVLTPRGEVAGCFVVRNEGQYGFMQVYGEDPSDPPLPGFRDGEPLAFRVNGVPAPAKPALAWTNDLTPHEVDLVVPDVQFAIYLPLLLRN